MLIVGAKGFAKELLEICNQLQSQDEICFYDDVSTDLPERLYGRYPILRSPEAAAAHFAQQPEFAIGTGNPQLRAMFFEKMQALGGRPVSVISPWARLGANGVQIGAGSCIMTGTIFTADITVGEGCLINLNCTIGHDTTIGRFSELSPAVNVSGHCHIGEYCNLGTNCIILPKVTLGNRVTVGAGAVVNKDVPDDTIVVGVPAKPLGR